MDKAQDVSQTHELGDTWAKNQWHALTENQKGHGKRGFFRFRMKALRQKGLKTNNKMRR